MSASLIFALLGFYLCGFASCFFLLVFLGYRVERRQQARPAQPAAPSVLLVRHDVHHHGLPSADDDGEAWKRGRDE